MSLVYGCCEDIEYLKSLEEERIELVGPDAEYYSLNRGHNVDKLYGEPVNDPLYGGSAPRGTPSRAEESWNFYPNLSSGQPALIIKCSIEYQEYDNRNPSVREEGLYVEYDAAVVISKNHWDRAIKDLPISTREPKEGDVIYVFNIWWDVIKVGRQGYIMDTPEFTGYRFDVKKRTHYTPDRKIG